jgi:[acyl-carrier-protein] S-malonyltransferase
VTAAWVAGSAVAVSDVDDRERALRSGPASAAMPMANSSEGRQLRRWLVQLMAAERLVAGEAVRRGITATGAPPLDELADRPGLLELGSVAAALLSQSALARALYLAVTEHVRVAEDRIERYYAGNPEQFAVEERRVVRHTTDQDVSLDNRPQRTLRRGELTGAVERAVFDAAPGDVVGPVEDPLGWHLLRLEAIEPARVRPLDEVRAEIERRLLAGARRRAFIAWLDGTSAELVRLAPGYEHPGDPSQPDNTHRH